MNRQLGAFSGLAMLLIILNHSIHMGVMTPAVLGYSPAGGVTGYLLSALQALGAFAVPILLFTSGSFVAYALGSGTMQRYRNFVWSSVKHLLLPYLLWSILFYILIFLHNDTSYTLSGYLHHLLVGYPFHFVPLLIFSYLGSVALVPLAKRFGWPLLLGIALYQLALLNIRSPGMLGFVFPQQLHVLFPPVLGNTLADWAIYFPLGMVFTLHANAIRPWLQRFWWLSLGATATLFTLGLLNAFAIVDAPLARFICPVAFLLVVPVVERSSIPFVRSLERLGKRSYGLYLVHLLVLDLMLFGLQLSASWIFGYPVLLFPLLFIVALNAPLLLMDRAARPPTVRAYRYVFG